MDTRFKVDLETLCTKMQQHPHTIDGSFGSECITFDAENDNIIVEMNDGTEYDISEVTQTADNQGLVGCKLADGNIAVIQFFRCAPLAVI